MRKRVNVLGWGIFCVTIFIMVWAVNAAAEKEYKVGSIWGFTGVYSTIQTIESQGVDDYYRYFNEKGGWLHPGLKGITIKHIQLDSGYTVPGYLKQWWSLVQQGVKIIACADSASICVVKPKAANEKVVMISTPLPDCSMFPPGWVFGPGISYPETFAAAIDWMEKQLKEDRPLRVAWLTHDNPFGRAPLKKCNAYAKKKGVKIYGPVFIPSMPVDITAELTRVMSYKPDVVMGNCSEAVAPIMANVERMGLHKKNVKFVFYWPPRAVMKAAPEAVETCLHYNTPWGVLGEDSPGMKVAEECHNKYRKKGSVYGGIMYTTGLYQGRAVLGAIEKALEKVALSKLTGEDIKKYGLERMNNYDMLGIGPNLTFTPNERRGIHHIRMVRIKNQRLVPLTGYIPVPDLKDY